MTDEQLTEAIARKLAHDNGFDPDQMLAPVGPKLCVGGQEYRTVGEPLLPAWQRLRPLAASMIEAVKSLDGEAKAAFSRFLL